METPDSEKPLTPKALAQLLTSSEYPVNIPKGLQQAAREAGLVIVYGASDDLMEFRGAINDEVGCYNGGTVLVDTEGLLPDYDDIDKRDKDDMRAYFRREPEGVSLEAVWDDEGYSWIYRTYIPHETFDVVEDDKLYCRGIVFDLAALRAKEDDHGAALRQARADAIEECAKVAEIRMADVSDTETAEWIAAVIRRLKEQGNG